MGYVSSFFYTRRVNLPPNVGIWILLDVLKNFLQIEVIVDLPLWMTNWFSEKITDIVYRFGFGSDFKDFFFFLTIMPQSIFLYCFWIFKPGCLDPLLIKTLVYKTGFLKEKHKCIPLGKEIKKVNSSRLCHLKIHLKYS